MAEWVFTYNGFTFGHGQPVELTDEGVEGLDLPGLRTSDSERDGSHGVDLGRDLADGRSLVAHLRLKDANPNSSLAAADRETILTDLARATAPRDDALPLTFQVGGRVAQRVYCRPRARRMAYDKTLAALGMALVDVQFVAADPLVYSDLEHQAVTGPAGSTGGIVFPWTFPITFGAAGSTGTIQAINAGNANAPWVARLDGPLTDPQILHVEQNRALTFDANGGLTIGAGQYVELRSDGREVLFEGTADVRTKLRLPDSRWFELTPGTQMIELAADAGNGGMTFTHRDAWWS